MKKFLLALLALPALFLASCSNDEPQPEVGTDGTVVFTAELPGVFARSFNDGTKATRLSYAVYETGTTTPVLSSRDAGAPQAQFSGLKAQLSLNLVKGKTYDVIFWADKPGSPYTFDPATQSITADYTTVAGNDDDRDAFFQVEKGMAVNGAMQKTITLRRPFAQINFGTNDLDQAQAVGADVAKTQLKVTGVYSTLNLLTGVASNPVDVTYTYATLPQGETFPVVGYDYLSMNYVLTGSDVPGSDVQVARKELVDCEFTIQNSKGGLINTISVSNVPVQRNYRTNIYGALLTSQVDYMIEILPDFYDPDHTVTQEVATPEDFIAALSSPLTKVINVNADLDLTDATLAQLTFDENKTINLADGVTVQLGNHNRLTAENGLTLTGKGKITNTSADNSDLGASYYKSLIHVMNGDLVIDGVTLENDPAYHYHGSSAQGRPYNSAAIAYWNSTNVNIKNARIISGEFTLCGMGRDVANGKITLADSYFESTSSGQNGTGNWSYALRIFGSEGSMDNCEVKGIQGGVSTDGGIKFVINSGKYTTVNSEGKNDAFYALYVTNSQVTVNGGEFSAALNRTGLPIEGTSAVVCGDNDTHLPSGSVIINGGKFSGKAYNHVTNTIYEPANGKTWVALTGQDPYKWTVSE